MLPPVLYLLHQGPQMRAAADIPSVHCVLTLEPLITIFRMTQRRIIGETDLLLLKSFQEQAASRVKVHLYH
jgi:hypothetical protein